MIDKILLDKIIKNEPLTKKDLTDHAERCKIDEEIRKIVKRRTRWKL